MGALPQDLVTQPTTATDPEEPRTTPAQKNHPTSITAQTKAASITSPHRWCNIPTNECGRLNDNTKCR